MRTNTFLSIAICGFLVSPADAMRRSDAMSGNELRLLSFAIPAMLAAGTLVASRFVEQNAERGVYLTCNENSQKQTLERVRSLRARGTVGVGTSALFNLSIFIARHRLGIQDWVLVDPAPEVQKFWETFKNIFQHANNIDEAFQTLEEAMLANPSDYFTDSFLNVRKAGTAASYQRWLAGKLALAKEELRAAQGELSFQQLKTLVTEHLILAPTDLTNPAEVRALAEYLSAHKFTVDTLYVSNINMALSEAELGVFRSCLANLRWQGASPKPSYLIEAGPSSFGKNARQLATETYQRIYEEWQVE